MLYKNYEVIIDRNCIRTPSFPHLWLADIFGSECNDIEIIVGGSNPKELFESAKLEIELCEIEYLKGRMKRSVDKILKLDKRNNKE